MNPIDSVGGGYNPGDIYEDSTGEAQHNPTDETPIIQQNREESSQAFCSPETELGPGGAYVSPEALLAWVENQTSGLYRELREKMGAVENKGKRKEELRKEIAANNNKEANQAELDKLNEDTQMAMMEIQELNSKINSTKQMASNLLSTWERTDNAIIGNLRG